MTTFSETIVACATANQNAALGIIRLSGENALPILKRIFFTKSGQPFSEIKPRYFHFGRLFDANKELIDECLAVWMPAPQTFTGEDVVEIHAHGNVHLLKKILKVILALDTDFPVRAAEAGEFSKRAFLNAKMDLTQAEAIHGLIHAESESSLKAHLANLDGALQRAVSGIREKLLLSLALIEASFEFPEEDIQTYDADQVWQLLFATQNLLEKLLSAYQTAKLHDEGFKVAILGKPNVGKSSLLNAILVEDRAIVTDIAGTTRDVIEGQKLISGLRFCFYDTAGLRETVDVVESQGIERSKNLIQKVDLVLYVTDDPRDELKVPWQEPTLFVLNKSDLLSHKDEPYLKKFDKVLSVRDGLDQKPFENLLLSQVSVNSVQNSFHVNQRQYHKIQTAFDFVQNLRQNEASFSETEILAEEVRHMISLLNEITGDITNDHVLGEIFQKFCIGK